MKKRLPSIITLSMLLFSANSLATSCDGIIVQQDNDASTKLVCQSKIYVTDLGGDIIGSTLFYNSPTNCIHKSDGYTIQKILCGNICFPGVTYRLVTNATQCINTLGKQVIGFTSTLGNSSFKHDENTYQLQQLIQFADNSRDLKVLKPVTGTITYSVTP